MSLLAAQATTPPVGQYPGVLELQLLDETPCVVGIPKRVQWDSIGLPTDETYTYETDGPGSSDAEAWTWTPEDTTTRSLVVRVKLAGELVGRVSTRLVVRPEVAVGSPVLKYATFGDSITETNGADAYTNVLSRLLTAGGVDWTSLGTKQQSSPDAGVYIEGYSGRTARWLAGLDVDGGSQTPVYTTGGPAPVPKFDDWFTAIGDTPTLLHIQLPGPNDSNAYGGAPEGMSAYHDTIIAALETVIADAQAAAPGLVIQIGTIFGMSSDDADFASHAARQAWQTKRHSLLKKEIAAFRRRTGANVRLAATHHCLNTANTWGNNVHPPITPNHTQIANEIYCAMRAVTG